MVILPELNTFSSPPGYNQIPLSFRSSFKNSFRDSKSPAQAKHRFFCKDVVAILLFILFD